MLKYARQFATLLGAIVVATSVSKAAPTILDDWTFEGTTASGNTKTYDYGVADSGALKIGSDASGNHSSASTVWSSPAGDKSAKALSSNNWSFGDYYQFTTSTTGYDDLTVSFEINGSATGPGSYGLFYSTDGTNFTEIGSNFSLTSGITWSAGSGSVQGTIKSADLSSITALDNASSVEFRIVDESTTTGGAINGSNVAAAGSGRVDDFEIVGTSAVPEPRTYALIAGLAVIGVAILARRKSILTA